MREPIQIVEIDQDFCSLTCGVAPCTAAGINCHNTLRTCQDTANYDPQPLTLRFAKPSDSLDEYSEYILPFLASVSTSPAEISVGGINSDIDALGRRASLSVTFKDSPHSDRVVDKYIDQRSYDAIKRGTFWSKWLARNPYYKNRAVRVLDGVAGQPLAEMQPRSYIIESIDGPNSSGAVNLKAVDILKKADGKKSQAPIATDAELVIAIDDVVTSFDIQNITVSELPSSGTVRIDDEVMTYSGVTDNTTYLTLTGVVRGTDGTAADTHDANAAVQPCLRYTNTLCWEIVEDLLVNYAGIDASFIPSAAWDTEGSTWLSQFTLSALITEPEGVSMLIGEILEQCLFYIWWDERNQLIQMKAVRPATETPTKITDENNIIAGSISKKVKPEERASQLWVYYQQRDPTQSVDETKNYEKLRVRIDPAAESSQQYDERSIKRIYSRWITSDAQASNVAARLLNRYISPRQILTFKVDVKDRAVWTGDVIDVTTWQTVDVFGDPIETRYQVVSAKEENGETVTYNAIVYDYGGDVGIRYSFILPSTANDYESATQAELAKGCFISNADGKMSDGTDGWIIV